MDAWFHAAKTGDFLYIKRYCLDFIRQQNQFGQSCLIIASGQGFEKIVNYVVDAEHNMTDLEGLRAIDHAMIRKQQKIVSILQNYEGHNINRFQLKKNVLLAQNFIQKIIKHQNLQQTPMQYISELKTNKLLLSQILLLESEIANNVAIIKDEQFQIINQREEIYELQQQIQQKDVKYASDIATKNEDLSLNYQITSLQSQLQNQEYIHKSQIEELQSMILDLNQQNIEYKSSQKQQKSQISQLEDQVQSFSSQKEAFAQKLYFSYIKLLNEQQKENKLILKQYNMKQTQVTQVQEIEDPEITFYRAQKLQYVKQLYSRHQSNKTNFFLLFLAILSLLLVFL